MKPVSKTAFYCCGVRMADAEKRRPLCGDNYAKCFMDADARAFYEPFKSETRAARGNATRHRIIDDYLRSAIGANPHLTVITIGAGFDTRAYRLNAGTFVELDEPAVIALKNEKLPIATCKNKLARVPIDFASERLADKLAPFKTEAACIFVIEGVFMYLAESVIAETLQTLHQLFPNHTLICDLMRASFANKHSAGMRDRIERLGVTLQLVEDPYRIFAEHHYRATQMTSIVALSAKLGLPRLLRPLLRMLPDDLVQGYKVVVFDPFPVPAQRMVR
jgi:methyltransferase (TIGR00027 family)